MHNAIENNVIINKTHLLEEANIPISRCNSDKVKNRYGNALLNLCKCNDLFIANGRILSDRLGHFTSKNVSVVDYCIATPELICLINELVVHRFSHLFSDIHSPISITFKAYNKNYTKETGNKSPTSITETYNKWDTNKQHEFLANINNDNIETILSELQHFSVNSENSQISINNLVTQIGTLLTDTAKSTFGIKKKFISSCDIL